MADSLTGSGHEKVSLAKQEIILRDQGVLATPDRGDPQPTGHLELSYGHSVCAFSETHVHHFDLTGLESQVEVEFLLDDLFIHHSRDETRRRDVVDVEFLIRGFTKWVIEASDGRGDHEDLLRQLNRHEVGVVGVGDGNERIGVLDPGFAQGLYVVRKPMMNRPVEGRTQQFEGRLVHVYDGHIVAFVGECVGQVSSDTAATCNDNSHSVAMIG